MNQQILMQVDTSVSLTGLGVLLLAKHGTPLLESLDIHTQWQVQLLLPDGSSIETTASIEGISRPIENGKAAAVETRALLIAEASITMVPTGTTVMLRELND